jgi:hypothetical protein
MFPEHDLVAQVWKLRGDIGKGGRVVEAGPAVDSDADRPAEPSRHAVQLARPDGRSNRCRGRTQARATQHERIDLPPVGQLDRDGPTRPGTEVAENGREPLHLLGVLGVGGVPQAGTAPVGGDGDRVGVFLAHRRKSAGGDSSRHSHSSR